MNKLDAEKKELSLNVDSFGNPQKYSGKLAWANCIISLLLMNPGTFPSIPDMGVGLGRYTYETLDDIKNSLVPEIERQIRLYLPEIPFNSIEFIDKTEDRRKYIIMIITFNTESIEAVAVATKKTGKLIDFVVSM